ncbi:hypothetical protein QF026_000023 [Streptomyces aurantiacus]|uniref:hypothetical protein n=1 Tax=Streptomyces aurantiacus TaxID=47760 RepID=UPI00278EB610|nr:hypothetical protein [Streptomyces aurantiacus]MDQ0771557.1 hypothetical protein [Streptomyces aurantiacus]
MLRARYRASAALKRTTGRSYLELERELEPETAGDLSLVVHFFERLWIAVEHHAIARQHVTRLFGSTFYWWYEATFRVQFVPLSTEVSRSIRLLREWMVKNASAEQIESWRSSNEQWLPVIRPAVDGN